MTTSATYPLRSGCSKYGADMGRRDTVPETPAAPVRLSLVKMRLDCGGYDSGGAYWGWSPGTWIYRAVGDGAELFARASSREGAKSTVRRRVPGATFYR